MRFVVTAGPTREYVDPVRFLSNPSTGKMGFAIAEAAARRGHEVALIAGPVSLKTPSGVNRVDVVSAVDMLAACEAEVGFTGRTVFVAAAAVADWRPCRMAKCKLKKSAMTGLLKLTRNPDILKTIGRRYRRKNGEMRLVGFAAETGDPVREARRKCAEKGLDFIVANDVLEKNAGFAADTNHVTMVFRDGRVEKLPLMSKRKIARLIVRACENSFFSV